MTSDTNVLVKQFLTYSVQIRCVRTIPTSTVECCLSPLSWQEWINFFNKTWNWSLFPITFSINLPSIFKRIIGLKVFEVSYDSLLGLGIMVDIDVLKYNSQYPNLIHVLVMLMILLRHSIFLMISLICLQDSLSGLGVKSLPHLSIAKRNSSLKKEGHLV